MSLPAYAASVAANSLARCKGKKAFESYALATAVTTRKRQSKAHRPYAAYRCRDCRKWHVGAAPITGIHQRGVLAKQRHRARIEKEQEE